MMSKFNPTSRQQLPCGCCQMLTVHREVLMAVHCLNPHCPVPKHYVQDWVCSHCGVSMQGFIPETDKRDAELVIVDDQLFLPETKSHAQSVELPFWRPGQHDVDVSDPDANTWR